MDLVNRVKNILTRPKTEWQVIAHESATPASIYTRYVLILAAIGPLATLIRTGGRGIGAAFAQYVMALLVTYLVALVVNALVPTFGGKKDFIAALKLTAYSYTAVWIAAILGIIPVLGVLMLLAAIYSWYTFYLGVPVMLNVPREKAVGYTIAVVICGLLIGMIAGLVLLPALVGPTSVGNTI